VWPKAVAAIAAGTRLRAGPEAAVVAVQRQGLDLTQPVNAPALRELVVSWIEAGQAKAALEQADAAVQAHPDVAVFHQIRGLALAASGDASGARAAWDRALELEPRNAAALMELARSSARGGDVEAALDFYARAAAADRADAAPLVASAELLGSLGRAAEAEQSLAQALERDPYDGKVALRLAQLRLERAAPGEETQALLERAVRFRAGAEAKALLESTSAAPPAGGA
jgi:tetratricopeptide (TPR) repeat protein